MMDILKELEGAKRIGISGHLHPDGDCVGSCMGLYLYLKKKIKDADIRVFLEPVSNVFSLIRDIDVIDSEFPEEEPFDVFIMLDTNPERMAGAEKYFRQAKKTLHIDHHITNAPGMGDVNLVEPQASSTAELLTALIPEEELDADIALPLYIGIIHDTGVLQYSNTGRRTLELCARLIATGIPFTRLIDDTFYEKTERQTRIMGYVLDHCAMMLDGRVAAGVVDRELMQHYGVDKSDLDGIVNHLRYIKGVDCAVFMYELKENVYKASLRSSERIDAAAVCKTFGGGGHVRAAGATLEGRPEDILQKICEQIQKNL